MSKKFLFCKQKRAMLALETLVGLILSVLALFFVISFLASFLVTPENKKIAEDDMKSIADFIKNSKDSSKSNCYTSLKISNLENFQFSEEELSKNYFYIISEDSVSIVKISDLDSVLKQLSSKNLDYSAKVVKKKEFDEKIIFLYDDTFEGNAITNTLDELTQRLDMIYRFGQTDSELKLKKDKVKYIILKPKLLENKNSVTSYFNKIYDESYSINYLEPILVLNSGLIEVSEGKQIFYNPTSRYLFVAKTSYSEIIANGKLCSTEELIGKMAINYINQKNSKGEYVNLDKIDYINRRIIIDMKTENLDCDEKFYWENKPVCKKAQTLVDCNTIFPNLNSQITFPIFLEMVNNFYKSNNKCSQYTYSLKYEDLTFTEIINNKANLKFSEVFELYKDSNGPINIYKLSSEEKKEFVVDFANWVGVDNYEFNNVEKSYSNIAGFSDSKVYFYVTGDENNAQYYSFKHNYLRKTSVYNENKKEFEIKYYLNGKEIIEIEKLKGDLPGISFSDSDNKYVLRMKVNIEGKDYDILISPQQQYSISTLVK